MVTTTENGALEVKLPWYEQALYDSANRTVLAQTDGRGNISRFSAAGYWEIFRPDSFYSCLTTTDGSMELNESKTVTMLGRTQCIKTKNITCTTFLGDSEPAVFQCWEVKVPARLDFGFLSAGNGSLTAEPVAGSSLTKADSQTVLSHAWQLRLPDGRGVEIYASAPIEIRELQDIGAHLSVEVAENGRGTAGIGRETAGIGREKPANRFDIPTKELHLAFRAILPGKSASDEERRKHRQLSSGTQENTGAASSTIWRDFEEIFAHARTEAEEYSRRLIEEGAIIPAELRAEFISCLNCGLSSYKEVNDFRGFFAGVNYQAPLRTYYRDGYFTAISVLPFAPELVRNELLTLAMGIGSDGRAPSAVIGLNKVFWPDHWDAPAFFVILLGDYIAATGDRSILSEPVGAASLLELAKRALKSLDERTDSTGLVVRPIADRHDWADNVFREGYITYIESLYYRALICMENITGEPEYAIRAERVKNAVNDLLWMEDKGWYTDYRSPTRMENHLAIETILTVIFGIADGERTGRLLNNMERMLESVSNPEQPFGDWGTLCCWPPYRNKAYLVEKSSIDLSYHNGSDWPYWSCLYAWAKELHGMDGIYPLTRWFTYGLEQGWYTPVEYYGPTVGRGSFLQAWSATGTFAIHYKGCNPFKNNK